MKRIIKFLGYVPIDFDSALMGEKLYWARQVAGHFQEELAELLKVAPQTILFVELYKKNQRKLS